MSYECLQTDVANLHTGTKAEQSEFFLKMVEKHEPRVGSGPKHRCIYRFACEAAGVGCDYTYEVTAFGKTILEAKEENIISCKAD